MENRFECKQQRNKYTAYIDDLHAKVTGVKIIRLSGQWRKTLENAQNGFWDTYQHDGKSIPDGSSSTAQKLQFDIRTDGPQFRVDWFTTNKTGQIVGDGSFTVPYTKKFKKNDFKFYFFLKVMQETT